MSDINVKIIGTNPLVPTSNTTYYFNCKSIRVLPQNANKTFVPIQIEVNNVVYTLQDHGDMILIRLDSVNELLIEVHSPTAIDIQINGNPAQQAKRPIDVYSTLWTFLDQLV